MVDTLLDGVENRVRAWALEHRVRIEEYFRDFDKLRSGYVTVEQFRRVLSTMGFSFTEDEFKSVVQAYSSPVKNLFKYDAFCDSIDKVFTVKGLEKAPTMDLSEQTTMDLTKTTNSKRSTGGTLFSDNPEKKEHWERLMNYMRNMVKTRGVLVKQFFADFDKHHNGKVTIAQFQRAQPFKLTPADINLLIEVYSDGIDFKYNEWHNDIEGYHDGGAFGGHTFGESSIMRGTTGTLSSRDRQSRGGDQRDRSAAETEVDKLETKLKKMVLQHRIRVDENFRDYDRLRTGFITVPQFRAGLGSIKFPKYTLTEKDLDLLSNKYKVLMPDGYESVKYCDFVDEMETVFTVPGLEKAPTMSFRAPKELTLSSSVNLGDPSKESRLEEVLETIREAVRTRRILLKPLFQDFDRAIKGVYQTKHITRPRFARALHTLGLKLSYADVELICAKYDDLNNGDVNYVAFCHDVDPDFYMENEIESKALASTAARARSSHSRERTQAPVQDPTEIVNRIKVKVLTDRIRLEEFFRDFDPLRSWCCTLPQFRIGLSMAGIKVTDAEFEVLRSLCYDESKQPTPIRYMQFCDLINEVFTEKGLETKPTHELNSSQKLVATFKVARQPRMDPSSSITSQLSSILSRLSSEVFARRILLKPFFQDYDLHNSGRITRSQFRQCLSRIGIPLTDQEGKILEEAYVDLITNDADYLRFIKEIDDFENPDKAVAEQAASMAATASSRLRTSNIFGSTSRSLEELDYDKLMDKIKNHIAKCRIRAIEFFTDYDKLRHGFIPAHKFRTGLSMGIMTGPLKLTQNEVAILEDHYRHPEHPDMVLYTQFCADLDSVFTETNLEKCPRKEVNKFHTTPSPYPLQRTRAPGMDSGLDALLSKLVDRVKTRRILLKPRFQDHDPIRKERVTKTQFRSVLDVLALPMSDAEFNLLLDAFTDSRGDVDYASFCAAIQELEDRE